jgi:hypothetical protein
LYKSNVHEVAMVSIKLFAGVSAFVLASTLAAQTFTFSAPKTIIPQPVTPFNAGNLVLETDLNNDGSPTSSSLITRIPLAYSATWVTSATERETSRRRFL